IIMANVPPNDPNVDASAIVPAPVNPDHAPAQLVEEDAEEEEEDPEEDPEVDPEEDPEGDDDDDMEMDDEAEVIDSYMDDGSNNPPPPNSNDEETPPTSPVIPDADGQPIPPIALFGQNFHFSESSSTANLLTRNSKIVSTGPMCPNLRTAWKRLGKMEKLMSERINTEGRMKKKFKEQVRNVMSDLSGLKKKVLKPPSRLRERERVQNEANRAEGPNVAQVARECTFADFIKCSPITFCGNEGAVGLIRWIEKTKMVFTVSKCTEANKVVFAVATFQNQALTWSNSQVDTLGIDAVTRKMWAEMKVMMTEKFCPPEEIQRMECKLWNLRVKEMDISFYTTRFNKLVILCPGMVPRGVNRVDPESVKAAIRAERERVQNEANPAEGPNVDLVARECIFADFMKCSPITFRGNEGAVGLIRWIEKTEMVFTVATLGIETVTKKTWAEMKVMMTEEFCPPEEIQRMEGELWNLRVKEMDISSYTTRFNELVILCLGMVPTERKKVKAYIRGLSENIKGEVTSFEPATLSKAVRMAHTLMEHKVKAK
nr:hypothetical protein [Tanacetum cinerariifolium]